jgi:hypothetical protein
MQLHILRCVWDLIKTVIVPLHRVAELRNSYRGNLFFSVLRCLSFMEERSVLWRSWTTRVAASSCRGWAGDDDDKTLTKAARKHKVTTSLGALSKYFNCCCCASMLVPCGVGKAPESDCDDMVCLMLKHLGGWLTEPSITDFQQES